MKLKRSDVFGLESAFTSLMEVPLDPEVAFKVASNGILANDLAEKVRKTYKTVEGFDEVEKLRGEIFKSAGGTPSKNGGWSIPPDKVAEVVKQVDVFNEENQTVIDNQKIYQEKFDELLDKDVDIDFKTIDRKELTAEIEPGKLVLMIKTGILTDGDK